MTVTIRVHHGEQILIEAAQVPHVEALMWIAVALAAVDPRDDIGVDTMVCSLCGLNIDHQRDDPGPEDLDRHADSCPWAAAVRWRQETDR